MDDASSVADRRVHFAQSCILILDHDVVIPNHHQSSGPGAIFRALHPRNLAMHLPINVGSWAGNHPRRMSSGDDALPSLGIEEASPTSSPAASPRLSLRTPYLNGKKPAAIVSPVEPPLRSCLKPSQTDDQPPVSPVSPTIPGGFFQSPPSPTLTRGRSLSSAISPRLRQSQSPPLPPPNIPTEVIPLQECCITCVSATDLARSMGNAYRISWSAAAAAKKKRDDAEERVDILAGLKRAPYSLKWGSMLDGVDENAADEDEIDDGYGRPLEDESSDEPHSTSCPPGSPRAFDPLSKLDGTNRLPKSSSTSSLNKDWAPQKYYDAEDDEEDLFPLPSPSLSGHATPLTVSPASSTSHLPDVSGAPNGNPPSAKTHLVPPSTAFGLPTIAGSVSGSPRANSMSSAASVSSGGSGTSRKSGHSNQDHAAHRPSPLREASSSDITSSITSGDPYRKHAGSPGPVYTSVNTRKAGTPSLTSSSASGSSRTGSSRVWTTSFVPPPLPTRSHAATSHATTRKLAPAEGTGKSPLTLGAGIVASKVPSISAGSSSSKPPLPTKAEVDRGERVHPPPMPTYSGAQREVVIVASSKREKDSKRDRGGLQDEKPKGLPTDGNRGKAKEKVGKELPPLPPSSTIPSRPALATLQPPSSQGTPRTHSNSSESTPVASRAPSIGPGSSSRLPLTSDTYQDTVNSKSSSRGPPRTSETLAQDLELGRIATATQGTIRANSRPLPTRSNSLNAFSSPAYSDDDKLGPLTSPTITPKKKRASATAAGLLQPAGAGTNLRVSMGWSAAETTPDDPPGSPSAATSASTDSRDRSSSVEPRRRSRRSSTTSDTSAGGDGGSAGGNPRTRSSSIRRLWKGIGNMAGGLGAAAGAVHVT
ncbi:hypothetical protein FRB99_001846 [Tulasnella sp. 403]|nr:hypothetical protein FRB99_001846 [Tulasnella sp. 403]